MHICVILPLRGWGWTCWVLLYSPDIYLWFFFRRRSGFRCWRHWVEVASAPNFACGVGPLQDASASALLRARAGNHLGRALVYHRSCLLFIIVCIECPPPRRFVRWLNYLLNKYVISLLKLIFVSHLVSIYVGTLHIPYNMYIYFYIRQPTSYGKQTIIYFKYKTDQ